MRSLRTQLVLISTLITGVALIGFGALSWYLLARAERETVDIELESLAADFLRDLHPRTDFDEVRTKIETDHADRIAAGEMLLKVKDLWGDEEIYCSISDPDSFAAALPPGFPPPAPDARERPEWGRLKGSQKGPPERSDRPNPPRSRDDGPPPRGGPPGGGPPGEHQPGEGPSRDGPKDGRKGSPGDGLEGGPDDERVGFASISSDQGRWRLIALHERGYYVLAGLNLDKVNASLAGVKKAILFGIPLALVVIALGGWAVAERALRPIRKIAAATSHITARDLNERIPEGRNTDPEIAKLVTVLNGMMDRLEKGFSHASRFSADVSHELKTPISVIQAEIESGLRECNPGTPEENRLLVLREETDRLKSITRSLMLLSQADAGELIRKDEMVNLSQEIEALADDAEIIAESAGVRIESKVEAGAEIKGDPVLLRQALLNLINNAIKYNHEGGFVRIALTRESGYIRVAIENTGTGIPDEDSAKVFDRFYRADPSRTRGVGGFGLGLSLARAVIEGHGGRLDLIDSEKDLTRFEAGFWEK